MTVAILLATYNGASYLPDQLQSLLDQDYSDWKLYASDDGSSDLTREILDKFRAEHPSRLVMLKDGPRQGFVQNFLSLLFDGRIQAPYYAFCDQDDIWKPWKLSRAMALLRTQEDCAAVYCSRTELIDACGRTIGFSPLVDQPPSFANALVQSIAGGNTMVINTLAHRLLRTERRVCPISHDWWIYQIVSGTGGQIIYDSEASILYRQHGDNLIGANSRFRDRFLRARRLINNQFSVWNEKNIESLRPFIGRFTDKNRHIFHTFEQLRSPDLTVRLRALRATVVRRRALSDNLALATAIIANRF